MLPSLDNETSVRKRESLTVLLLLLPLFQERKGAAKKHQNCGFWTNSRKTSESEVWIDRQIALTTMEQLQVEPGTNFRQWRRKNVRAIQNRWQEQAITQTERKVTNISIEREMQAIFKEARRIFWTTALIISCHWPCWTGDDGNWNPSSCRTPDWFPFSREVRKPRRK